MIRQGIFSRRHSIDILEGLDLDFLNVNHAAAAAAAASQEFGNFADGPSADFAYDPTHLIAASQLILGADDDIIGMGMGSSYMPQAGGGDWYERHERPPLPTGGPYDASGGFNRARRNSLHSGDLKDWTAIDYSDHIIASSQIFDDEIDLSMYEMMAADLERSGNGKGVKKGTSKSTGSSGSRQGNRASSPAGDGATDAKTPGSSSEKPGGSGATHYYDTSSSAGMMKSTGLTPMLAGMSSGMGPSKLPLYPGNGMMSVGGMSALEMGGSLMSSASMDMGMKYGYSPVMGGGPAMLQNEDGTYIKMPADYIGAYSPQSRRARIERFLEKRSRRVWTKKVKYDVRKNFADSRLRVKGRFVKKEDEELMRELLTI